MQLSTVLAAVTVAVVAGSAVAPVGAPASPAADCAKHPALSPTACCTQLVSPATWTASFTTTAGGGATFNVAV